MSEVLEHREVQFLEKVLPPQLYSLNFVRTSTVTREVTVKDRFARDVAAELSIDQGFSKKVLKDAVYSSHPIQVVKYSKDIAETKLSRVLDIFSNWDVNLITADIAPV